MADPAFDPSRLVPVDEEPAFDPSRLVPIDAPPVNIFREKTQKVVQAPVGMRPSEVEYLDDVQNGGKKKEDFLGFSYIGNPVDAAAGYIRGIVQGAVNIGTLDLPYREKKLSELESMKKLGQDVDADLVATRKRISDIQAIRAQMPAVIKGMGLERKPTIIGDLGQGGQSLSQTVGLTMITGNPLLAMAAMGLQQKSADYQEAREAGLNIDLADQSSTTSAGISAAIEGIGTNALFKAWGESNILKRAFKGLITQGLEEGAQETSNILVKNNFGVTDTDFSTGAKQVAYAAFIGALIGAPVSAMIDNSPQEFEEKYGMAPEQGKELAELIEKTATESPEAQSALTQATKQILQDEESPLTDNTENEAKVAKIIEDFKNGKDIDLSELPDDVRTSIEGMGRAEMSVPRVEVSETLKKSLEDTNNEEQAFVKNEWEPFVRSTEQISQIEDYAQSLEKIGPYAKQLTDRVSRFFSGITGSDIESRTAKDAFDNLEETMSMASNDNVDIDEFIDALSSKLKLIADNLPAGKSKKLFSLLDDISDRRIDAQTSSVARVDQLEKIKKLDPDFDYESATPQQIRDRALALSDEKFSSRQEALREKHSAILSKRDKIKIALKNIEDGETDFSTPFYQNLFSELGGGGNSTPPPTDTSLPQSQPDREGDYKANRERKRKSGFFSDAGKVLSSAADLADDIFTPVSTRLGKIDEGLKHAVRQFVFKTGLHTQEDNAKVKPFMDKVRKNMSVDDYRDLDLALKNGDMQKIAELLDQYDLHKEYDNMREVLDKIHAEAKAAGIELGFLENYFPRKVKKDRVAEYLAFLKGKSEWSLIETALQAEDPSNTFTPEEKAEFINKWLRGYKNDKLKMARPSFSKERSIDYITPEMNDFYEDSFPVLVNYIAAMRHGIESRKLFGGSSEDVDSNIGEYVLSLLEQGVIEPRQEDAIRKMLKAVVEPTGTRGVVTWTKNVTYIYTMGSPISALTQLQDLGFSLYKNGYFRTTGSLLKTIAGKQVLTKEELGITNILQEFEDTDRSGRAVRAVFKAAGLTGMDNIGKSVYIDAAWGRLRKAAKKGGKKFTEQMEAVFGDGSQQVIDDLVAGNLTEDTKYLLFSELSDVQPVSLAEMPELYLRGGNGRVFYMLKTYTVKQIDLYRRDVFDKLGRTSVKENAEGLQNLIKMAAALMLMGMTTDELKNFFLGRDVDLSDLVMDNIYKTLGFTKYQVYKARKEGFMSTFYQTVTGTPIFAPIDDIASDAWDIYQGDMEAKDARSFSRVPVFGKFYYWWWGGGRAEINEANQ